jgi:Uma2 family endonuclease
MTQLLKKPDAVPPERRFSVADYYRMADSGLFLDERVELIDGRVIRMPPQGNNHDVAITLAHELLLRLFTDGYWVRQQMSLDFSPMSSPEPDVAVVDADARTNLLKPRSALLVIEVSETTLNYDRNVKQRLYASNNIADYWIINLQDWQLEIYREPQLDSHGQFTHRYRDPSIFMLRESVTPLALPGASISVAQLFPSVRNAQ